MKPGITTSEYILKTVAPIFNKQGYVGTSLSHLTKATGLTKGAIYCNFTNKEELALKAFELNVKVAILPLFSVVEKQKGSLKKLYAITDYHRTYYNLVSNMGGCPMLRVGMDAKFNNPLLFEKVQKLSKTFINGLVKIITDGIDSNEIRQDTDVLQKAKLILSMIEGSSLLAFTHNDNSFITNTMDHIDKEILKTMKL